MLFVKGNEEHHRSSDAERLLADSWLFYTSMPEAPFIVVQLCNQTWSGLLEGRFKNQRHTSLHIKTVISYCSCQMKMSMVTLVKRSVIDTQLGNLHIKENIMYEYKFAIYIIKQNVYANNCAL